jgi:chromosome condensin MukBEF MukE localization factor
MLEFYASPLGTAIGLAGAGTYALFVQSMPTPLYPNDTDKLRAGLMLAQSILERRAYRSEFQNVLAAHFRRSLAQLGIGGRSRIALRGRTTSPFDRLEALLRHLGLMGMGCS